MKRQPLAGCLPVCEYSILTICKLNDLMTALNSGFTVQHSALSSTIAVIGIGFIRGGRRNEAQIPNAR